MKSQHRAILLFFSQYLPPGSVAFPSPTHRQPSCFKNFACVTSGLPLLRSSVPHTATSCQQLCASTDNCRQFTHYDDTVTPRLANSCWLFAKCEKRRRGCTGCTSGPPSCGLTCSLPQETRGGAWWCTGNSTQPPTSQELVKFGTETQN